MVHAVWGHNTLMALSLRARCEGQDIVSIHHFEASGAEEADITGDADAVGWAAGVATAWIAADRARWLAFQPSTYSLANVVAQVLERPGVYERKLTETENPMAAAGTLGTGDITLNASPLIRWRTPVAGKHHRGRTYTGPISLTTVTAGALHSDFIPVVEAYASNLVTRFSGLTPIAGALLTVYSKPLDAGKQQWTVRVGGSLVVRSNLDYAGNSTNITSFAVDPLVRTMRRREIGVGS